MCWGQDERKRGAAKPNVTAILLSGFWIPKPRKVVPGNAHGHTQMRPGFSPVGSPAFKRELLLRAGGPQNETKILSNILTGLNFKYDGEAMKWACSN